MTTGSRSGREDPPEQLPPAFGVSGPSAPEAVTTPPDGSGTQRSAARHSHRKRGSMLREVPVLALIAVGLALLIKTFFVQAFFIPSGSMEQTLHIGDRVLVNKLVYHLRSIHRGEIVVFDTKGTAFAGAEESTATLPTNAVARGVRDVQCFLGLGCPGQVDFIKRVIALPGDRVACCDSRGRVEVNGIGLNEPYTDSIATSGAAEPLTEIPFCAGPIPGAAPSLSCPSGSPPVVVQPGMLWVMGDNRDHSADSRYYGQVPIGKVVGRAFVRIWPPSRIGLLQVPADFRSALAAGTPLGAGVGGSLLFVFSPLRRRRRSPSTGGLLSAGRRLRR